MTRLLRGVFAPFALLTCGGGVFAPGASAREIAPFHAALAVRWGGGAGSDAFRNDLSRSLAEVLATGCFAGVAIADGELPAADSDLFLTVVLSQVVDETRFDDSIAGTLRPGEPGQELRRVARFEVSVDATLSARATGAVVRRKHLVANVLRRPVYVGEDPQATARAEAIDRIVNDLAKALGCGGAKLERKIRDALGTTDQPASGPR
jgi:hypothetical protein